MLEVVAKYVKVALAALLQVEGNTGLKEDIFHHLLSEDTRTLGVALSESIQFHNDRVLRVDLQGVVLVHLIELAWVLGLHHGHDHAHGGRDLADKDCRLIFQTFGDGDLADLRGELILKPEAESGDIFFWQRVNTCACLSSLVVLANPYVFGDILIWSCLHVGEAVTLVLS